MKLNSTNVLIVGFALALALLGGVAWLNLGHAAHVQESAQWVAHTEKVRGELARLLMRLIDIETGARGFVVTGEPAYLEPFEAARTNVNAQFGDLRALTRDNPLQQAKCNGLEPLIARRIALAQVVVDARRNAGFEAARLELINGQGKAVMDQIRAELANMDAEEQSLLIQRSAAARREGDTARWMTLAGSSLSTLLLIVVFALVLRENRLRQQANLALGASEENLAVTLQSIGDGVLATDAGGRVTRLNAVAEALTGWTQAEAAGRPVAEIFHIINETTRQPAFLPVADTLAKGTIHGLANHTELIARDGTERPIADSCAPIRDREVRVIGAVLVFRDVTEQRQASARMATNLKVLAEFKAALDEHALVAITDARGKITYVNDKFCAISKYAREELMGQDHRIINSGHHPKAFIRELWETITNGRVWKGELKNRAKDGTIYWVDTSIVPFLDEHGKPAQYIAIRTDITERKAAEAEVHRSRAIFENLFESLPGLYLVLTPDLKIVTASDAYLKATMTQREQILGRGLFEVFPDNPDDVDATGTSNLRASLDRVRQTAALDTMAIQKYDVRRPDGVFEERYWSPINSPLLGVNRRIEYIIHRVEDVTEFVRQKAQPAGHTAELRARMEQMEAEIFQSSQKVQAANQQLEAAYKELEAFSYSVSHDLRAPLRHIHGYVEMLTAATGGQLADKPRRYLQTIAAASVEMGQLIDDLLAFSRTGRVELRLERVPLDGLVPEAIRGLEMATQGRNIDWKIAPLPAVRGDVALLRQVLANLVGNAVKYSRGRDPARIEIGIAGEEAGRAIIFVRDNGAGFDMQYASKLFGVFQRLHRAEEFEGTGIGLATVSRIIARHGGRVWAEGKLGDGAAFYFTLERADEGVKS